MKLHVKIGTMPAQYVVAPKLRRRPWVGESFEVREQKHGPLEHVRLTDIKCPDGDGSGIHTEGCAKTHLHYCERW